MLCVLHMMSIAAPAQAKIYTVVSVTWEGRAVETFNLNAIQEFRKVYPGPILHFVNPAYMAKSEGQRAKTAETIRSAIASQDEVGLYIQGWKSLTDKAGIRFQPSPTYWGNILSTPECQDDCGAEIPISNFSADDMAKLTAISLKIFDDNQLPKPTSFWVGGWLSTPKMMETAAAYGLKYDFSPIPPLLLKRRMSEFPLYKWLTDLWKGVTVFSTPWQQPTKQGSLTVLPSTFGSVDYLAYEDVQFMLDQIVRQQQNQPSQTFFIHLNIYQETAYQTLPLSKRLWQAIVKKLDAAKLKPEILALPLRENGLPFSVLSSNTAAQK